MSVEDYDKIMKEMDILNWQVLSLEEELTKIEEDQKTQMEELAEISATTERQLEEIRQAQKRTDNTIDESTLQRTCKQAIDYFLHDIIDPYHTTISLQIRIEYHQMKIFKKITDNKMTFQMLKEETKNQFGKEEKDFFFVAENGDIFLDEILVTPALFTLSNVKIDKYEPVLYVLDKIIHKPIVEKEKEEKYIYNEDSDLDLSDSLLSKIKRTIKANTLKIIYTLFLVFLIALYSENCINYRQADQYRSLMFSLNPYTKKFTENSVEPNQFLDILKEELKYFVKLPDNLLYNIGIYDSLVKMKFIRLIQKRAKQNIFCSSERLQYDNSKSCSNLLEFDEEPIEDGKFIYRKEPSHKKIRGAFYDYDNSGYIWDIPIDSQAEMEKTLNENKQWVNSLTASVILIMNFYSVNTNSIIILRFLFERESLFLKSRYDIQFIYLDQKIDWYLIACILITFVMLVLQFFLLRVAKRNEEDKNKILNQGELTIAKRMTNCILYIKTNYRSPKAMLIFRFTLLAKYNDNPINDSGSYEDFQGITQNYEFVTAANCFNLLVLYVDLMAILASYFDELQTITSGISKYLSNVYYYFMLFVMPFMFISFYISYLLFGDDFMTFYKSIPFIILKVFQTFDHGSMDHDDYANEEIIIKERLLSMILLIIPKTLIEVSWITLGILGILLDQHIQRLVNDAKKRKEEMLMQRAQLRMEEKKKQEQEMKEKKEKIEIVHLFTSP